MHIPQSLNRGMGRMAGRRQLRFGAKARAMTVAFIGILVLINVVVARYHRRWDLTATGDFSLSQPTLQIISGLKQPVQIIGFFGKQDAAQRNDVESRLKEYTAHSKL